MSAPTQSLISRLLSQLRPDVAAEFGLCPEQVQGTEHARLALIVGPNSSGKSFLLRYLGAMARAFRDEGAKAGARRKKGPAAPHEIMALSMAARTSPGMHRMVYGLGEDTFGTGASSIIGLRGLLDSAAGREHSTFVLLDEPELGLSDEYLDDAAHRCMAYLSGAGEQCTGMVITSHNPDFLRAVLDQAQKHGVEAAEIVLGDGGYPSIEAWLGRTIVPASLDDLSTTNIERFRRLTRLLQDPAKGAWGSTTPSQVARRPRRATKAPRTPRSGTRGGTDPA